MTATVSMDAQTGALTLHAALHRLESRQPLKHQIAFARHGTRLLFLANGRLIQEYHDESRHGPVLDGGRIDIRNWSGHRGWFRHLTIRRLPAL